MTTTTTTENTNVIDMLASKIREKAIFPDITIKFKDNKIIRCHRYILSTDSTYFNDFFTKNSDAVSMDLSDNTFPIAKYEAFVLYLIFIYDLHDNIFNPNKSIKTDFWYNLFDINQYIESTCLLKLLKNFNKSYNPMAIAFINYITNNKKFYLIYIDLISDIAKQISLSTCQSSTINTIWIILNEKAKDIPCLDRQYTLLSKHFENIEENKKAVIIYIASKYNIISKYTFFTELKNVNIEKLCVNCDYILFDPYLATFNKKVDEAKKTT